MPVFTADKWSKGGSLWTHFEVETPRCFKVVYCIILLIHIYNQTQNGGGCKCAVEVFIYIVDLQVFIMEYFFPNLLSFWPPRHNRVKVVEALCVGSFSCQSNWDTLDSSFEILEWLKVGRVRECVFCSRFWKIFLAVSVGFSFTIVERGWGINNTILWIRVLFRVNATLSTYLHSLHIKTPNSLLVYFDTLCPNTPHRGIKLLLMKRASLFELALDLNISILP